MTTTKQEKSIKGIALDGILKNPTLVLLLGLCPTLGASNTLANGIALGLATMFVLFFSNILVSLLRNVIPNSVRIPSYLIIIATFVTVVDMLLAAYFPELSAAIGTFVRLIIVNCIIFARAEQFASKNGVGRSAVDALSMGAGFLLAIAALAAIREFLATFAKIELFAQTAGGFIVLAFLIVGFNYGLKFFQSKKPAQAEAPQANQ